MEDGHPTLPEKDCEEQILKFEKQQGIRLPEEYRDFLLHVGNGGAGSYYSARIYRVQEEPVIYPKMSDEEWDRMTAPESRTHENARFDYKGSQMVLKGGACMGASRPEGQLTSNLMRQFDYFGLDYRGAWKLLMDDCFSAICKGTCPAHIL